MHIVGGILLLVVVFGVGFFMYAAHVFDPLILPISKGLNANTATSTIASNRSQYYREVRIQFVSLGSGLDEPMVASLGATPTKDPGITVSGWSMKTDKGTYAIPKATNVYSPSVPGVPPEDIYLRTGDVVNFYAGKNPQGKLQAIRSSMNQWQIWLGVDFLAIPHGTVTLYDGKGKTVDEYKY